ncbi:hypothetical protein SAG0110_01785 [Streptococcus agalactiae BSU167]|nr:hypothetical protein SAG0110_01785 [Streptococcus agalactiae BSU167]
MSHLQDDLYVSSCQIAQLWKEECNIFLKIYYKYNQNSQLADQLFDDNLTARLTLLMN